MTLLRDLIEIPEQVNKGDLVMELASGIDHVEQTVAEYVVTPQLVEAFDEAVGIVAQSARDGQSRAAYLHGSFGSGKSHFMAVLHLILRGEPAARRIAELHATLAKHDPALRGTKWLLVPYHMLGKKSLEQGILGGYADVVARLHPDAPEAPVYVDREILENAVNLRRDMGDDAFFSALNRGGGAVSGWGKYSAEWTASSFEAAAAAPPGDATREALVGALLRSLLSSFRAAHATDADAFLDLDKGLAAITRHAKGLGYDGIVLFLDELILWLASRMAEGGWAQNEASKVPKLRESGDATRTIPIVSFVARQRDLREFIGKGAPGAEQAAFADTLDYGDGRFSVVPLEDQNLPEIARKRVLRPRGEEAAQAIDAAFRQIQADASVNRDVLLTSTGTVEHFRATYPFTPALMQVLVALSSALQRNRTALRVLLELLSRRRDELELGEIVGVGEIWDVIMESTEPFGDAMKAQAEQARKLYREKLRPMLLVDAGITEADVPSQPWGSPFRANDRLVKTLLIAALVPQAEPVRGLTASRLAALNHGSIRSRIAGKETAALVRRLREWSGRIGELKVGEDPNDPTVSIALSGVDVETVLTRARAADKPGARRQKVREILFEEIGLDERQLATALTYDHVWRGTARTAEVRFGNVRDPSELPDAALRPTGDGWCAVIDFPFDEETYTPSDDLARLDAWRAANPQGAKTICWIPAFFSEASMNELGRLVVHEEVLAGDRFRLYADHMSETERHSARQILETQRDALRNRVRLGLRQAYGVERATPEMIELAQLGEREAGFVETLSDFVVQRPVGATLRAAFEHLLAQGLAHEFPRHPELRREPRARDLNTVLEVLRRAIGQPGQRLAISDRPTRELLADVAQPVGLGTVAETAFVASDRWAQLVSRNIAGAGGRATVADARGWLAGTELHGVPALIENLVIIVAVEQLGRRFSAPGASVARLDDHLEIVEQALPEPAAWDEAVRRAGALLGMTPNPARTGPTVAQLADELARRAGESAVEARALAPRLSERAALLEVRGDFPRLRTARAASELLDVVASASDEVERLERFGRHRLPEGLTDQTLGFSLTTASLVNGLLQREGWSTIEQVAALAAGGDAEATAALEPLRAALADDEFATPLEPRFSAAVRAGTELIARRLGGPGPSAIESRRVRGIDAARDVLDEITQDPRAGELDITISWRPSST